MMTRKTKKLIYNTFIICVLCIGVVYVCARFIHLGNVELSLIYI